MDYDRAHATFRYDPETGELFWRIRTHGRNGVKRPGDPAGSLTRSQGFPRVNITYQRGRYMRARIAWLLMTGSWPPVQIRHRDGDGSNDRWDNLVLAETPQPPRGKRLLAKEAKARRLADQGLSGTQL